MARKSFSSSALHFAHTPFFMIADRTHRRSRRCAFSLIGLTSLVLLCSSVAVLGLPRLMHGAERARAAEAFAYLEHIHQLQQTHHQQTGRYATHPLRLDLARVAPVDFTFRSPSAESDAVTSTGWSASLIRQGASGSYGKYCITFDESGYAPHRSTIGLDLLPLPISGLNTDTRNR